MNPLKSSQAKSSHTTEHHIAALQHTIASLRTARSSRLVPRLAPVTTIWLHWIAHFQSIRIANIRRAHRAAMCGRRGRRCILPITTNSPTQSHHFHASQSVSKSVFFEGDICIVPESVDTASCIRKRRPTVGSNNFDCSVRIVVHAQV